MKKTLVALAALAATSAFAQSTVTLYGIADIWMGKLKVTTTTGGLTVANATNAALTKDGVLSLGSTQPSGVSRNLMGSGGINGSRWGLRGSEDLGGGLKANFQFESGFNLDSGSSAQGGLLFGRQAFAGLSGSFGEIRLGRQYSAYDDARGGADLLGHSAFSATSAGNTAWGLGRDYTFRVDNSIRYSTPNMSGFTAAVHYGLGENKTAAGGAGSVFSFHVAYNNGPVAVFLAHQQDKNPTGAGAIAIANGGFQLSGGATTKETHTFLSGAYDFGAAKLRIAYNQSSDNAVGGPSADKEFTFGVAAPVGPVTLAAEYATMKNSAVKGNALGFQAQYNLSKRTFAYVGLQNVKSDTKAIGPVTSSKSTLYAAGIRHAF